MQENTRSKGESQSIREIRETADGSHTLYLPHLDEHFHSTHGALRESRHVFINKGLAHRVLNKAELHILEIGFGTGLNALLTLEFCLENKVQIKYTGLELYPLEEELWSGLNYPKLLDSHSDWQTMFDELHRCEWGRWNSISDGFQLLKRKEDFLEIDMNEETYDLVYFDAFGFRAQEEMWADDLFEKLWRSCRAGAVLVTYAAKGSVRRGMQSAGFEVERLEGPPGKREMLRATKP